MGYSRSAQPLIFKAATAKVGMMKLLLTRQRLWPASTLFLTGGLITS